MSIEGKAVAGGKAMFIVGWVLSSLIILMFIPLAAINLVYQNDAMRQGMEQTGYKAHHVKIIVILQILCGVLYAFPRTATLGAVLITAYLGGAVATHIRIDDGMWFPAVIVAGIAWLGLLLRDARLRRQLPIRRG